MGECYTKASADLEMFQFLNWEVGIWVLVNLYFMLCVFWKHLGNQWDNGSQSFHTAALHGRDGGGSRLSFYPCAVLLVQQWWWWEICGSQIWPLGWGASNEGPNESVGSLGVHTGTSLDSEVLKIELMPTQGRGEIIWGKSSGGEQVSTIIPRWPSNSV